MLENLKFKLFSAAILASPGAGVGSGSGYGAAAAIAFGLLRVAAQAIWRHAAPRAFAADWLAACLHRIHEFREQRHA